MKPEYIIGSILAVILIAGGVIFFSGGESKTFTKDGDYDEFPYIELVNPTGFVNSDGLTLGELVGKKVIMIDFMTYSCINCQRTFPYLNAWYEKYKDQGLEIVGIHTPEFAFEKDINNVRNAAEEFGLEFPLALDNDYETWRAYGNRFWPRKYLIDIHGNVVYDHIGEGKYEETEKKIVELLGERDVVLGMNETDSISGLVSESVIGERSQAKSPEVYFGSFRNSKYLANGNISISGEQSLNFPERFTSNRLYLDGVWDIQGEYAKADNPAKIAYKYTAKEVYMVARSDNPVKMEIWQDGEFVKEITISESKLYTLIEDESVGQHLLELRVEGNGIEVYTFTFG